MPALSIAATAFGLVLCALAFTPGRRSRASCFARAVGMQAILAVPIGLAQFLWAIEGAAARDFPGLVFGPFVAVPFNMGGLTCAAAFESVSRAGLLPQRQSVVLDHLGIYLTMWAVQTSILAGVLAGRTRATGRILADRTILLVLAGALANGVLGITWPWWGT